MTSPAGFSWRGWWRVAKRTWSEAAKDNVSLVAAGVSFYAFLALLPLLAAIVLTYGILADPSTVIEHVREFATAMPVEAAAFIGEQLMYVVTTAAEKKGLGLLTAILLSLFSARAAAGAIVSALNITYEETEKRGLIAINLVSLGITVGGVLFAVFGLIGATSLTALQDLLPLSAPPLVVLLKILGNIVIAAWIAGLAAVLYRFGPCRSRARWVWVVPGAILFAAIWTGLTLGFSFYVAHFGSFGATYGSLATVAIFLTWMYVASYAFLLGAELNSELEHETARDSTTGPERQLGERGAWTADHVAD